MRNTPTWIFLAFLALLTGCGAEVEKPPLPAIIDAVEVNAADAESALIKECTSIVDRCEMEWVDRIVVIPILDPDRLDVFSCENVMRAKDDGCRHVPAGVLSSEGETGHATEEENVDQTQQAYSDSGYLYPAPGGLDGPSYTPIGPGSGSGWGGGWRNDPQYKAYFNTPDPNLNKMRQIVQQHEYDRIREENRKRALPAPPRGDNKPFDPSIYHYGPYGRDTTPQPQKRPWYDPDLTQAKELLKTYWYKFEDEMAIPGPGQSKENVSCNLACANAISLGCEQVQNICSTMNSVGFNFAGKQVVITCAGLRALACVAAPIFSGALCQATLCTGI